MRMLHPAILLLPILAGAANFGRVNDPDGYVNIRMQASRTSQVLETVNQSECVETFGSNDGWTHIAYTSKNGTTSGYIRSSRLLKKPPCEGQGVEVALGKCTYGTILLEEVHTIPDLQKWFAQFSSCKNSDADEQIATLLSNLLIEKWEPNLLEINDFQSDNAFISFVISHIDATWSDANLDALAGPEKTCNAVKAASFCTQMKAKARKVRGK